MVLFAKSGQRAIEGILLNDLADDLVSSLTAHGSDCSRNDGDGRILLRNGGVDHVEVKLKWTVDNCLQAGPSGMLL